MLRPLLRPLAALALLLVLAACSNTPRRPEPAADRGALLLRQLLDDAERVATATGVPREHPRFATVRAGFTQWAQDPVVARWLGRLLRDGASGPMLLGHLQARSASGLTRLDDAQAERHLAWLAGQLERVAPERCARQLAELGGIQASSLRAVADLLPEEDIERHFELGLRALRADLEGRPERPVLGSERRRSVGQRLERDVRRAQAGPASRKDACAAASALLSTPGRWDDAERHDGLTLLLELVQRGLRPSAPGRPGRGAGRAQPSPSSTLADQA